MMRGEKKRMRNTRPALTVLLVDQRLDETDNPLLPCRSGVEIAAHLGVAVSGPGEHPGRRGLLLA